MLLLLLLELDARSEGPMGRALLASVLLASPLLRVGPALTRSLARQPLQQVCKGVRLARLPCRRIIEHVSAALRAWADLLRHNVLQRSPPLGRAVSAQAAADPHRALGRLEP